MSDQCQSVSINIKAASGQCQHSGRAVSNQCQGSVGSVSGEFQCQSAVSHSLYKSDLRRPHRPG